MQAAFFDIDGVLSIPCYLHADGSFSAGFPVKQWEDYNRKCDDTYHYCKTPLIVKKILDQLKEHHIPCFVLSVEGVKEAEENKRRFIRERYADYFSDEDIIIVAKKEDKIRYLTDFMTEHCFIPQDIYFLDDSFDLVLQALDKGFYAKHISEYLTAYEDAGNGVLQIHEPILPYYV